MMAKDTFPTSLPHRAGRAAQTLVLFSGTRLVLTDEDSDKREEFTVYVVSDGTAELYGSATEEAGRIQKVLLMQVLPPVVAQAK